MTDMKCMFCGEPAHIMECPGLKTTKCLCPECDFKVRSFQFDAVLTALGLLGKGRP